MPEAPESGSRRKGGENKTQEGGAEGLSQEAGGGYKEQESRACKMLFCNYMTSIHIQ